MHNIQFRLLPSEAFSPLSFSLPLLSSSPTMLSDWIRRRNREGLSGILGQIRTFLKVIFFNQRLLKDSPTSTSFVPSLNRSFVLRLLSPFHPFCLSPFFLTGDLSIPSRSIFLCLESNKVSGFRWRIQLISFGMRRVPAYASRRNFREYASE